MTDKRTEVVDESRAWLYLLLFFFFFFRDRVITSAEACAGRANSRNAFDAREIFEASMSCTLLANSTLFVLFCFCLHSFRDIRRHNDIDATIITTIYCERHSPDCTLAPFFHGQCRLIGSKASFSSTESIHRRSRKEGASPNKHIMPKQTKQLA